MTTAVGFDFDHTLGFDNHLERVAFGRLAKELGAPIDIEEPRQRDLIELQLTSFRAAEIPMSAMLEAFVATLPLRGEALLWTPDVLVERYCEICYALVDDMVHPMDGAVDCIAALVRDGIPIGILTNGWSPLQEKKIARALGYFPGPVLVSEAIGAYKPSADAFRLLEATLDCPGSGLWYVGDNPVADIDGARSYGLRAVWLTDHAAPYPEGLKPPTARIDRLAALPAIVRGG
jgi:putative hydrolase of the HAD superfamily